MRRHWKAGAAGFIGPIGQLQPDTSTRLPVHRLVRHLGPLYLPRKPMTFFLFVVIPDASAPSLIGKRTIAGLQAPGVLVSLRVPRLPKKMPYWDSR